MISRGLGEIASDVELVSGSWSAVVCDREHLAPPAVFAGQTWQSELPSALPL